MAIFTDDFLFPLCIAKKGAADLDRFAGSAFAIDNKGHIVTCKHIIENVQSDELIIAKDLKSNQFHELTAIRTHPKYDFCLSKIDAIKKNISPVPYRKFGMGLEIAAFGFTYNGKFEGRIKVDQRCLKGNIVLLAEHEHIFDKRSPSVIETSFPSIEGFSGGPLFTGECKYLIGMMYGNRESRIEAHSFIEIDKNGEKYKEVHNRIVELGLAHSVYDNLRMIKEVQ